MLKAYDSEQKSARKERVHTKRQILLERGELKEDAAQQPFGDAVVRRNIRSDDTKETNGVSSIADVVDEDGQSSGGESFETGKTYETAATKSKLGDDEDEEDEEEEKAVAEEEQEEEDQEEDEEEEGHEEEDPEEEEEEPTTMEDFLNDMLVRR